MSVGVLGGTFDPIHVGHLRAAENAREFLGLERVLFVPAGRPPHRPGPLTAARDRYAMVCLATAHHPAFVPCDLELDGEGPSYTADTLERVHNMFPEQALFLIVGSDTVGDVHGWREPERLLRLCTLAMVERPGAKFDANSSGRVVHAAGSGLDVSATEVRQRLSRGSSVRYLVPIAVADYIAKRRLYL